MLQSLNTSIVYRSTFIVLGIALLVGSCFALFSFYWASHKEQTQANNRMGTLLSTVESTTSIACYLLDANLASEVSRGLLKNEDVSSVRIFSGSTTLAQLSRDSGAQQASSPTDMVRQDTATSTIRDVFSPFNLQEKVCQIELEPNLIFIKQQATDQARVIVYPLLLQTLLMASAVVYIVLTKITRPIKNISDRLHYLKPEEGAKLILPSENEKDEIGQLVRDVNGILEKFVNILGDERQLRITHEIGEKKFQTIFDNAETGIFLLKTSGEVISYNPAFLQLLAIDSPTPQENGNTALMNALEGQQLRLHLIIGKANSQGQAIAEDFSIDVGQPLRRKWLHVVISPVDDGVLQGLLNDITERKIREEEANQLAVTDHLTGISNRLGFDREMTRLSQEVRKGQLSGFFLLLIDLDEFKQINDRHGHDVGDHVLRHFTQLVTRILRKSDFVARLGGDEFTVILKDLQKAEKAQEIAKKIIEQTRLPVQIDQDISLEIGASIGITYVGYADFDKNDVLREADEAMYAVKKSGKNNYGFYSPAKSV